jgi:hypothetical protein
VPGVGNLVGVVGFLSQVRIADRIRRQQVDLVAIAWIDLRERDRRGDLRLQMVVDHGRRAECAVVADANRLIVRRLDHNRDARGGHGMVDAGELVHAHAGGHAHVPADHELILDVRAALGTRGLAGRDRQVEAVLANVAAVRQRVPLPEQPRITRLRRRRSSARR